MLKNKSNIPTSVTEGISEVGTPDMKYYAFDWDDNIMTMPTKIVVLDDNGNEVGMSTEDFATYRSQIGKEPFNYKGSEIVGFAELPFRNFKEEGNRDFVIDAMEGKVGPAWSDFVEAINNGSIFSIITARGHNPEILKQAIYNMILANFNGINKELLAKNLRKYRDLMDEDEKSDNEIIKDYMELNRYYPVTFGQGSAANPEELKVDAMRDFASYIREMSDKLNKKALVKNKVSNKFLPTIGFSDDDIKNIEVMKKSFKDKPESEMLRMYSTAGGTKKKV
jgi:hypothetical protein